MDRKIEKLKRKERNIARKSTLLILHPPSPHCRHSFLSATARSSRFDQDWRGGGQGGLPTQRATSPRAPLFSEKQPIDQATAGTGRDRTGQEALHQTEASPCFSLAVRPDCSLWRGWIRKGENAQHNAFMVQLVGGDRFKYRASVSIEDSTTP